jgi:uncharacterized membrane protein
MRISPRGATLGTAVVLLIGVFAAPWLQGRAPLPGLWLRWLFAAACHQRPERSFIVWGAPLAVCARCVGIYAGAIPGAILGGLQRAQASAALYTFAAALALNGIDVASELAGLHGNLPWLRFALGMALGTGAGMLLSNPAFPRVRSDSAETSFTLPRETRSALR